MDDFDIFTQFLTQTFKRKDYELREVNPLNTDLSPIYLFIFKNYPSPELTTFVTYGLSEVTHPKWHFGRPELILSVESEDENWGVTLAGIVIQFKGKKSFSYGSTYLMDEPITEASQMAGFVIFKPSFINHEDSALQTSSKTVYLAQAYPIYTGEAEMIKQKTFEDFWNHKGFKDVYDVNRKEIT